MFGTEGVDADSGDPISKSLSHTFTVTSTAASSVSPSKGPVAIAAGEKTGSSQTLQLNIPIAYNFKLTADTKITVGFKLPNKFISFGALLGAGGKSWTGLSADVKKAELW